MRLVLALHNYLKYKEKGLFWIVVNDVTDCLCSLNRHNQENTGIVKSLWSLCEIWMEVQEKRSVWEGRNL